MGLNRRVQRSQEKKAFHQFSENWKRLKLYQDTKYAQIRAENREPTPEEVKSIGKLRGRRPSFNEWKVLNLRAVEMEMKQKEQRQELSTEQLQAIDQLSWDLPGDEEDNS